jgi:hypothetical protein
VTEAALIPSTQSNALLTEISRETDEESRALLDTAEEEARAIVARAHADARRRVHEANVALRRKARHRMVLAEAQVAAAERARIHRGAAEKLRAAWPLLEEALAARWQDTEMRKSWTDSIARLAVERLRPGAWTVEHPADWSEAEQQTFRRAIAESGAEVSFASNRDIAQGLRVRSENAVLDATPSGLLADRNTVEAELLAEIERGGAGAES